MAYAIILLSGESRRFKNDTPKQFTFVNGKPLFLYATETFLSHRDIEGVVLVTLKDYVNDLRDTVKANKPVLVVQGGSSRRESSYLGLKALKELGIKESDKVLIHDAARPLVTSEMIDGVIKELDVSKSCTIASNCVNTLVDVNGNYVDRNQIKIVETPQGFEYGSVVKAHELGSKDVTDDTMLLKELGINTSLVLSDSINIKVTTKEDIEIVKAILEGRNV